MRSSSSRTPTRRARSASGTSSAARASTEVEDGWEDRWRTFHRPVGVGRLWVGPPWEHPPADALAVVIDPGRAFGTGAHPTTQLCLGCCSRLEPARCSTSAADRACSRSQRACSGSRRSRAVDVEPAAADATLANARVNGVDGRGRASSAPRTRSRRRRPSLRTSRCGRRRARGAHRGGHARHVRISGARSSPWCRRGRTSSAVVLDGWAADVSNEPDPAVRSARWRRFASIFSAARSRMPTCKRCARRCSRTATSSARR